MAPDFRQAMIGKPVQDVIATGFTPADQEHRGAARTHGHVKTPDNNAPGQIWWLTHRAISDTDHSFDLLFF